MSDASPGRQASSEVAKETARPVTTRDSGSNDFTEGAGSPNKHSNPFASFWSRRKWHDDRYERFISPCLEDYPQGYPRLAAHANSDIDTLLFRRFGWLRCRALLHLQDELQVLETSLRDLDRKHEAEASHRLISKRIDEAFYEEGTAYTRTAMMNEIKVKLKEYDDLLARQHSITSLPKPRKREFRSYFDWMINDPPVVEEELQFIYHKEDFLALGQQVDSWLGPLIDSISRILPNTIMKGLLTSKATRTKTRDSNTTYYSNERWDVLVKIIVNLAAISLLVLPTALLYVLKTSRITKLSVLVVFVSVFNVALAALTSAKRHEIFNATAAYCAVLVVFLGSISEPQSS